MPACNVINMKYVFIYVPFDVNHPINCFALATNNRDRVIIESQESL